jgi:O-acetylhomoserine/O-acetylserine sulfhydrylase-like pyridoxal-dependent enzyme
MCRWLAYSGSPILMKDVLYGGTNSLVDQSLRSRGWCSAPQS